MKNFKGLIYFIIFFIAWIILITLTWQYPIFLLITLMSLSVVYFIFFKTKNDLIVYLIAAIFGPIGEATISSSGLWTYYGMTIFRIPPWLPMAWGITAVAVFRLINSVKKQ